MQFPAIAGPTGCGKTLLALELAERWNGEIVSVDAGAVWRGLDVGTATPTAAMRARVRHHLVSVADPDETYHVGRFVAEARAACADIVARGKTPLFVGGTMMYFHVLRAGLSPVPPVPPSVAEAVAAEVAAAPADAHASLARADAETAARVAVGDVQRVHRALSVWRASGKPLSAWQKEPPSPPFPLRLVRLMPSDKAAHRARLAARLRRMWDDGLETETRRLLEHWRLPLAAPPLRLIGYRQAAAKCAGLTDDAQMRRDAEVATRRLAKRQATWLRRWTDAPAADPFAPAPEKTLAAAFAGGG